MTNSQAPQPAPTARLVERLLAEADLCRNDGAHDIANLLDEAAVAASDLAKAAHGVVGLARLAAARLSTYRAAIEGLSEKASKFAAADEPCGYPACGYPCDRLPDCNDATGAKA
jgi:hypothetical protein